MNDAAPIDLIPDWVKETKEEILVLVPTGLKAAEGEMPLSLEVAAWDDTIGQWHGAWRNTDGEGGFAHMEPIAWAFAPDLDDDIAAEYGIEMEERAV